MVIKMIIISILFWTAGYITARYIHCKQSKTAPKKDYLKSRQYGHAFTDDL